MGRTKKVSQVSEQIQRRRDGWPKITGACGCWEWPKVKAALDRWAHHPIEGVAIGNQLAWKPEGYHEPIECTQAYIAEAKRLGLEVQPWIGNIVSAGLANDGCFFPTVSYDATNGIITLPDNGHTRNNVDFVKTMDPLNQKVTMEVYGQFSHTTLVQVVDRLTARVVTKPPGVNNGTITVRLWFTRPCATYAGDGKCEYHWLDRHNWNRAAEFFDLIPHSSVHIDLEPNMENGQRVNGGIRYPRQFWGLICDAAFSLIQKCQAAGAVITTWPGWIDGCPFGCMFLGAGNVVRSVDEGTYDSAFDDGAALSSIAERKRITESVGLVYVPAFRANVLRDDCADRIMVKVTAAGIEEAIIYFENTEDGTFSDAWRAA